MASTAVVHLSQQEGVSTLKSMLALAVPLWVHRFLGVPIESVFDRKRIEEIVLVICEKGDIILFKSSNKGETAQAFNALAEGIARLSFCPGGVKCFGMHFEYVHGKPWLEGKHGVPCDACGFGNLSAVAGSMWAEASTRARATP